MDPAEVLDTGDEFSPRAHLDGTVAGMRCDTTGLASGPLTFCYTGLANNGLVVIVGMTPLRVSPLSAFADSAGDNVHFFF